MYDGGNARDSIRLDNLHMLNADLEPWASCKAHYMESNHSQEMMDRLQLFCSSSIT